MTPLPRPGKAARARLALAIGLAVTSIAGSVLLAAADITRGTVTWAHHTPASAAPLFLIAAAIAAISIGRPPEGRHGLLPLVAVLAFTAWGTGQVTPSPAAPGPLWARGSAGQAGGTPVHASTGTRRARRSDRD